MKKHLYLTGALVLLLVLVGSATLVSADRPAARPAAQTAATLEGPRWVLVSYATRDGKTLQAIAGAEATARSQDPDQINNVGRTSNGFPDLYFIPDIGLNDCNLPNVAQWLQIDAQVGLSGRDPDAIAVPGQPAADNPRRERTGQAGQ